MKVALERLLADARADADVVAVLLYGSTARSEERSDSDIDVALVLGGRPKPRDLSEKRLRYASRHDLDVQVFEQLPIYVRHRVLRDGRVLWTRDEDLLYEIAWRTVQEFEDFRPHYESYLRTVERDRP